MRTPRMLRPTQKSGAGQAQKEEYDFDGASQNLLGDQNDSALSGLHVVVRYTLPRVAFNSSFSGTVAAIHGYTQQPSMQVAREATASYSCVARREPRVGVNTRTEVLCAGTTSGSVVLWRFPLPQRHGGVPPPPNTLPGPLVLGTHRATVTSLAFYDDTILVSGSSDCTLRLWDVHLQYISTQAPGFRDGSRCVQSICAHESSITHVAVHGPWVVSAGSNDGTVKVWGCAPGREKLSFPFLTPLQVIVLDSRITTMYVGELRAVEGVVADLIIATADGNVAMFRSTEDALVQTTKRMAVSASSTAASVVPVVSNSPPSKSESAADLQQQQQHRISVFRIVKQVRTHFPDGVIPTSTTPLQQLGQSTNNKNSGGFFESMIAAPDHLQQAQQQQQQQSMTGAHGGSLTNIVPLTELNAIMTLGYSASCFARDTLNFSVMNAMAHPDVNVSSAPGNNVRFVHCGYDAKKEELLLVDSLGELFVWSTKAARIVFRTSVVDGAFWLLPVGERGFWVVGRRDICLIRIEREEHRLEHRAHKERIIAVLLAPPREWWSMFFSGGAHSSNMSAAAAAQKKKEELHKRLLRAELNADEGNNDENSSDEPFASWGGGGGGDARKKQQQTKKRQDYDDDDDDMMMSTTLVGASASATEELMRRKRQQDAEEAAAAAAELVEHTKSQLEEITPWLVSASVDNNICVWNSNMKCMHTMKEKRSEIASFCLLWTQPGFVVSGHEDGSVKVWALTATAAAAMKTQQSSAAPSLQSLTSQSATDMLTNQKSSAAAAAAAAAGSFQEGGGVAGFMPPGTNGGGFISASEAFSQDSSSNAFHFNAHANTVSVVGEGLHRRCPFAVHRSFEPYPHLFSASYDGTLATWSMPTSGGSRVKCEARVKCSDAEIVSAVYDATQYCYWVGTNRGEVTAWGVDDLKPKQRLSSAAQQLQQPPKRGVSMMMEFDAFNNSNNNNGGGGGGGDLALTSRRSRRKSKIEQQRQHLASGGIAHSEAATSITLDANYIFTGSEDGTMRMWNGYSGEMHHALAYDKEGVKLLRKTVARGKFDSSSSSSSSSDDDDEKKKKKFEDELFGSSSGSQLSSNNNVTTPSTQRRGARIAGDVHHMFVLPETGHIVVGTRLGVVTLFDQATGRPTAIGTTNKARVQNTAAIALQQQQQQDHHQLQRDAQNRRQQQRKAAMMMAAGNATSSASSDAPSTPRRSARGGSGVTSARAALLNRAAAAVAASSPRLAPEMIVPPSASSMKRRASSGGGILAPAPPSNNSSGGSGLVGDDGGTNDQRVVKESAATIRDKMFADDFADKISREVCCLVLCPDKKEMVAGLGNGSIVRLALSALKPVAGNKPVTAQLDPHSNNKRSGEEEDSGFVSFSTEVQNFDHSGTK